MLAVVAFVGLVGFTLGCGSVLTGPDGGGGGAAGTTGVGGTTGTGGAGGGAPCVRNGISYPSGTTIPSGDCNSCYCHGGQIACTGIACPPIDAGSTCAFDTTYTYGDNGGFKPYQDTTTLAPPASYRHTRSPLVTDPPDISCAPALPACGTLDRYSPSDIMRAIEDTDVQNALAIPTPPLYGADARQVDGTVFQFLRADGRGFFAGGPCWTSGACVEVPVGINRLVSALRALDEQQLADPSCASLR